MKETTIRLLKRKLAVYRYCLEEWRQNGCELSSALVYRDQARALLDSLSASGEAGVDLQARWQELTTQLEQNRVKAPRLYQTYLQQELAKELYLLEADLGQLPRLIYEEALRTWVAVEAAGHILAELERILGPAAVEADRARYESLWREMEARAAALPEEHDVRYARPADLPAPPPPLTLAGVLEAVRDWPPERREVLRQALAVAESKADYEIY